MSHTDVRWLRKVALAGALLGLAACADRAAVPTAGPTFDLSRGDRHDDHEEHEGRGRAGAAAVTVWAARGRDGTTDIVVTSYAAADTLFQTPAGCITKVEVKAYPANSGRDHHEGEDVWHREFKGLRTGSTWTYTARGLDVGMRVAVEAKVGCLADRRSDDVDAQTTVLRRTDPAVTALTVADSNFVGQPTLVSATVSELNLEQSATFTCVLLVDNVPSDSLVGVAVPAGGRAVCNFAPVFGGPGTVQLTVRLSAVAPRDDNTGNNARTARLRVVTYRPPPGGTIAPADTAALAVFRITTDLHDDTTTSSDSTLYSHRLASDPSVLIDTSYTFTSMTGNQQTGWFDGIVYTAVAFPLVQVFATQATDSAGYHVTYDSTARANVAGVPGSAGATCADLSTGAATARVTLLICSFVPDASFPNGHTTITYDRTATSAASVAKHYFVEYTNGVPSACSPTTPDPTLTAPCYTNATPAGPALRPYGTSYTFTVVLQTASRRYSATVVVPLSKAPLSVVESLPCSDMTEPANGPDVPAMLLHACEGSNLATVRKSGVTAPLVGLTQTVP